MFTVVDNNRVCYYATQTCIYVSEDKDLTFTLVNTNNGLPSNGVNYVLILKQ